MAKRYLTKGLDHSLGEEARSGGALGLMFALGTAFAALSGCGDPPPPVAVLGQAIVNGERADGDEAVVGLMSGGQIICSGVLIEPTIVVTAAHCLADAEVRSVTQVFFGAGPHLGGEMREVESFAVHPRFDRELGAHDIGALQLTEPAPDYVTPISLDPEEFPALQGGMSLRIVGYGEDTDENSNFATKRSGETTISAVEDTSFFHEADPALTCYGDSGGPAFLLMDDQEYLVGIATGGGEECDEFGEHSRIDVHWDDFLRHFPSPTAELGQKCHFDNNCISETCVEPLTYGASRYCSELCASTEDCEGSMACVLDEAGDRVCRPIDREPGALGASCQDDADCASGLCTDSPDKGVCSLLCFPENELVCPEGYRCELGEDFGMCIESAAAPRSGCSLTRTPPAGSPRRHGATVLGLALLMLLFRRPTRKAAPARWR